MKSTTNCPYAGYSYISEWLNKSIIKFAHTLRFIMVLLAVNAFFFTVSASEMPSKLQSVSPGLKFNTSFPVRVIKTNISACGNGSDGSIKVIPEGGTAPFVFSWSGPNGFSSSQEAIDGLPAGFYNVEITDANANVTTVNNMHLSFAYSPYITHSGTVSGYCNNTGSIILYGNAGVQPYIYSLNGTNYQESNTFNNLAAGTYTAYVKDLMGCISTKQVTVLSTAPIVVSSFVRTASSCNNDGVIELYRTGGIGPYLYSLDNINYQVSNVFSNLASSMFYTAWVMDSKGCKASQSNIRVTQVSGLTVAATKTNSSTCVNDGTIRINANGGMGAYTYSLDDITYQSGNSFFNIAPGTYTCWAKDYKGCKGTVSVTMGINPFVVTANIGTTNSCNRNGSIQLFRTGGTGPYKYSLNSINYSSSNVFTGLPGGTYTGWVKDSKGCIASLAGITVVTGYEITATVIKTNSSTCVNNGTILLTAGSGTAPYTYSLDNINYQAGNVFTNLGPGNYVGWVKDAFGCKTSVNANIGLNHIEVSVAVTNVTNCSVPDGTVQIFKTGGTGGFTYSLDGQEYQTRNVFSGLDQGTYMAFVKDSNICIGVLPDVIVNTVCISFTGKNYSSERININNEKGNLNIRAYPNPTTTEFLIQPEGFGPGKVTIIVTDIMGRKLFQSEKESNQQLRVGKNYKAGLYHVQVMQGNDKKSARLIKE